ncbi:MAG: YicC/YloC family endoribonuclease [Thermodesulfobacteriota bacterium]
MKSMTGYGQSALDTEIGNVIVEIKSENHRFLDIKILSPDYLNGIENIVTDIIKANIKRGKLRLKISVQENQKKINAILSENLKDNYASLKKIRTELKIKEDIKFEHLLMLKELLNSEQAFELSDNTTSKIKTAVKKAIDNFDKSRTIEGEKLKKDILNRLKNLKSIIEKIKKKRKNFSKESGEKLKERVESLLNDTVIDESRLIQEIVFLTERSEITEELVRLDAHISKFEQNANKTSSIGKELDFLIQEINRESGTISAKCKDAGLSHLTIELRSELEKIKEQIQNIE